MKKISVFAIFMLSIISCTRLDIGVQYFSYFVKSEVDEMFDLSTPQKQFFEKKFSAQLEKVKREQFPKYANYLDKIAKTYQENSMTAVKASQFFDEGEKIFLGTAPQWKNTIEDVVMNLKDEQFKSFEEYFKEKISKDKKKLSTEKDRAKKQMDTMEKWIDQTVEYLTPAQEEKLKQLIKTNPRPKVLAWKSQEHVFGQFKQSFPDLVKRKEFLDKFLTDWRQLQLPEYVTAREIYIEKVKDFVVDLSVNLTEKQKQNLIENLTKRASELRKLAH